MPIDADEEYSNAAVPKPHFAVVLVPARSRSRFSASCVEIFDSALSAMNHADPSNRKFAARVSGPSKSSEGQSIFYLLEWLDESP
ncbi:MAG: hypothetical protein KDJ38_04365 [Gammaproteobacteria bacterium]|nr:hypothetical protein [Gammaproteobacteria bacterium]